MIFSLNGAVVREDLQVSANPSSNSFFSDHHWLWSAVVAVIVVPIIFRLTASMPMITLLRLSSTALRSLGNRRCADPSAADQPGCVALEQSILQSTVRFQVVWWIPQAGGNGFDDLRRIGHGTVLPGCRLLTHNHFDIPLPPLAPPGVQTDFYFYDVADTFVGRSHQVTIVLADKETLVLALAGGDQDCPLGDLASHPARFAQQPSVAVTGATEAAQIDWDGARSFVSWKPIVAVVAEDGVERVVLEGPVKLGASGGGVYVDGRYVATTWTRVTYRLAATKEPLPGGQSWAVLLDVQQTR